MKSLLVACALILGVTLSISLADVPSVQCRVIWSFGIPCPDVNVALVTQIKAWQNGSCQSGGENCSYELISATPDLIKAKHIAPSSGRVDDLQFPLVPAEAVCKVTGASVSEARDPVDTGISYCSLQNVVDGSGLTKVAGYKQFTNKWICPGSASANCSIV